MESQEFQQSRLERVRDLFVFSCYTGISYVDLMNLTPNSISLGIDGGNWIFTYRQKTKTKVKIPLLSKVQELVDKILGHTRLTTTQIYARVLDKKVSEDMNKLKSFLSQKKITHKIPEGNQIKPFGLI